MFIRYHLFDEKIISKCCFYFSCLQEQYEFVFKTVVKMFEKALHGTAYGYENLSEV